MCSTSVLYPQKNYFIYLLKSDIRDNVVISQPASPNNVYKFNLSTSDVLYKCRQFFVTNVNLVRHCCYSLEVSYIYMLRSYF